MRGGKTSASLARFSTISRLMKCVSFPPAATAPLSGQAGARNRQAGSAGFGQARTTEITFRAKLRCKPG